MSVVWHKVWRDLARNKARTAPVVLSIAVGVFAMGVALGTHGVMRSSLADERVRSRTADFALRGEGLDAEAVQAALREPGVVDAELETVAVIRWRLVGDVRWRAGVLIAREDYRAQRVSLVELLEGEWPGEGVDSPGDSAVAVERQTARHLDIPVGASIMLDAGRGERVLVTGVVRKPYAVSPQYDGPAVFYATPGVVTRLTGVGDANKLFIRAAKGEAASEADQATAAQRRIEDRLQRAGSSVSGVVDSENPDTLEDYLNAGFLSLEALGLVSMGVSAFLIVNTMNAIAAQQTWQIGVMKVLGGTFWRLVRICLSTALVYGGLALLVAIPLGAIGAHAMSRWMLDWVNIVATGAMPVCPGAVAIQGLTALAVTLLAAAAPVIGGARISPYRAMTSYGLGGTFGPGALDRMAGRLRALPSAITLSVRNLFRRKKRVVLMILAFTLVGVMFIGVLSTRLSLKQTLEVMIDGFPYDAEAVSPRLYRANHLIEITESVPGVAKADVWDRAGADLSQANGDRDGFVYGIPTAQTVFRPRIVGGRNLLPGDGLAVLLNHQVAAAERIQVGDEVVFSIAGRESAWTVVGLVFLTGRATPIGYVPLEALAQAAGHAGRANMVIVTTEAQDAKSRERVADGLRAVYAAQHVEMKVQSADEFRRQIEMSVDASSYLLLTLALLAGVVGAIGLAGTLSMNVVERRREIGVMRAIGASSQAIFGIFVGEGVTVGALSWLLAVPLSYPGARFFSAAIGQALFEAELEFRYSVPAVAIWLVLVLVLSALSSLWPAWQASRVSVREALAYE